MLQNIPWPSLHERRRNSRLTIPYKISFEEVAVRKENRPQDHQLPT